MGAVTAQQEKQASALSVVRELPTAQRGGLFCSERVDILLLYYESLNMGKMTF